jgi:transcriptional regulator of acetoin/glycerol metabolism
VAASNQEYVFQRDRDRLTIGSGAECDIVLDAPYVSHLHVEIERRGEVVIGYDRSKNGTYFGGQRRDRAEITDGMLLVLGTTPLVAFSERSRTLRARVQRYLGFEESRQQAVDEALTVARTDRHLVLIGERGAGHRGLAETAHGGSPRHARPFVAPQSAADWATPAEQGSVLRSAEHGSLFVFEGDLPADRAMLVDGLTRGTYGVRLFFASSSRERALEALGLDLFSQAMVVDIPPLRARLADLPRLAGAAAVEPAEHQVVAGAAILTSADLATMAAYPWPKNIEEFERVISYVAAIRRHGSVRAAAKALSVPRATIEARLARVGLSAKARR